MTSKSIIDYLLKYNLVNQNLSTDKLSFANPFIANDSVRMDTIKRLAHEIFPLVPFDQINYLSNNVVDYINFLAIKMGANVSDSTIDNALWNQITQNNMRDIKMVIQMLFPFIEDSDGTKKKKLTSFLNIYTEKDATGKYVYTNSQYNRCIRIPDDQKPAVSKFKSLFMLKNNTKKVNYIERPYSFATFYHNLLLLLMTTDMISNKLYVNWTDICPIRMDQYKSTFLFKKTVEKVTNWNESVPFLFKGYIDLSEGLSMSDLYNVIATHLFMNVREHKWMLYDINYFGKPISYISYIGDKINLDSIWNEVPWATLNESKKNTFKIEWSNLFNSGNNDDLTVVGSFHVFFSRFHKNKDKLIDNKLLIPSKNININGIDDNELKEMRATDARLGLMNVPIEEIYTFFYDQIKRFKTTWYYYHMITKNQQYIGQFDHETHGTIYVTHKNLFNFCQSMCCIELDFIGASEEDDGFPEMPSIWYSLPHFLKNMVINRLFKTKTVTETLEWFRISNYFRRFYKNIPKEAFADLTLKIHNIIKDNIVDIIFQSLIYNGMLSQFIPQPLITDDDHIKRSGIIDDKKIFLYKKDRLKELILNDENRRLYESESFYYLTHKSYGSLDKHVVFSDDNKPASYFDAICGKEQSWTFIFVMDWISQINFYHRYANNRVMYITGAPGIGKSSQIPKLLVYAQRIIDYNNRGKTACTVPRISVLIKASESISAELGVPIKDINETANYYIQTKYSEDEHISNEYDSFLKIMTDGSLLQEIKQSPFLTREKKGSVFVDQKGNKLDWIKTYSATNIYDIVIIDEAHEHNYNMDLIITLMRDAMYINNSLKLVIMSATMDDDDPIYRRYFRNINDNRAYPLNGFIDFNIIDRCNIDRRVHISKPDGLASRFEVFDHYLTKEESTKITMDSYLRSGIEMTLKIIQRTNSGDVLLFLPTTKDIETAIKELNDKTPSNILVVGFHSKISTEMRYFINNISTKLKSFDISKSSISEKVKIKQKVKPGTYTRAIIVATNIAEASLTISSLRYVVDTGFANTKIYNPLTNTEDMTIVPVSGTSSQQRRGRVGRVASGHFFPLYDNKKIATNKTRYKMSDENVTSIITDLLKIYPNDFPIIFDFSENNSLLTNDINSHFLLKKYRNTLPLRKRKILESDLTFAYPYLDIIVNNYCYIKSNVLDSSMYIYSYYGRGLRSINIYSSLEKYMEIEHDDYFDHITPFFSRCYTGYDFKVLVDEMLNFYVIHPDENIIKRDLYLGMFIGLNYGSELTNAYKQLLIDINKFTGTDFEAAMKLSKVLLPKIFLIRKRAISNMIFTLIPHETIDYMIWMSKNKKNYLPFVGTVVDNLKELYKRDTLVKTHLYNNMIKINSMLSINVLSDPQKMFWFSYALSKDTVIDVLALIHMLSVEKISKWASSDNMLIDNFFSLYSNRHSDIYFLFTIWNKLKDYLLSKHINLFFNIGEIIQKFHINKRFFLSGTSSEDTDLFNLLNKSNRLNTSHELYYYFKKTKNVMKMDISNELITFAKNNYLNETTLKNFFSEFIESYFSYQKNRWLYEYEIKHQLVTENINVVDVVSKSLDFPFHSDDKYNQIMEMYMRSHANNLCYFDGENYYPITVAAKIYKAKWSKHVVNYENTLVSIQSSFIIYDRLISTKIDENTTNVTIHYDTNININLLMELNPFYFHHFLFTDENDKDAEDVKELLMPYYNDIFLVKFLGKLNDPQLNKVIKKTN